MAHKSKNIIIVIIGIFTIWVIGGLSIFFLFEEGKRGEIGDMFGAINALFSGLALGGIIIALFLQQKELSLQREELSLTRKELSKSAAAQENISRLESNSAQLNAHQTLLAFYIKAMEGVNTSNHLNMNKKESYQAINEELEEIKRLNQILKNLTATEH